MVFLRVIPPTSQCQWVQPPTDAGALDAGDVCRLGGILPWLVILAAMEVVSLAFSSF
jgi:hypothetical protein